MANLDTHHKPQNIGDRVAYTIVKFFNFYFFLYLFLPKVAHRMIGYFEEEAVISYTLYLEEIDAGRQENIKAPKIAIEYWGLEQDATLCDVVVVVRDDECKHRDVNHRFADEI